MAVVDLAKQVGTIKGDLYVYNGSTLVRLGVGSDDQVLTADAAESAGVKWAAASGGAGAASGATIQQSTVQSIPANTNTALIFDGADKLDTDAYHDPATNNTRITIPAGKAGKYLVSGAYRTSTPRGLFAQILKNGTTRITPVVGNEATQANMSVVVMSTLVDLAESDYIELIANQNDSFGDGTGSNLTTPSGCWMSATLIGT